MEENQLTWDADAFSQAADLVAQSELKQANLPVEDALFLRSTRIAN